MKQNSTKGYVILGILFVLISVISFAVPTLKTAAFWIAYLFTVVSFAAQIVTWKNAFGKEDTMKSKFLGFSIGHISIVYLILQIIALGIFLFIPALPVWSAIIICSVIAGVSVICMISDDTGRNEINRVEEKVKKKVFYIKNLQADVELMADSETDSETKTELIKLAEKIRFSDPMSNELLEDLESRISAKIAELKSAPNKSEIIKELNLLFDERTKKCKILK